MAVQRYRIYCLQGAYGLQFKGFLIKKQNRVPGCPLIEVTRRFF
jgi:hypothetical protein